MEVRRQKADQADGSADEPWPQVAARPAVCLHQLVEEQARRTPHALAAVQGARSLTYTALDGRANRLATALVERGLEAQQTVGVCAERSLENLVATLAVLKAGGAYVPVDPTYPQHRIDTIVQNASTRVILAEPRFLDRLPRSDYAILGVDADDDRELASGPAARSAAHHLAYVIYTSGSSGQPKGVMVEHRSVVNLVQFYLDFHRLGAGDRGTQLMRPGFDASVVEIWPMLAAGATICIPDERVYMEPARLLAWMAELGITFCDVPTVLAEALFEEPLSRQLRLRALVTGGDKLRRRPPAGFPVPVYDQYGPTENTVVTTQGRVLPVDESDEPLDIGRPIPNHRTYVLDEGLAPVPDGDVGELVVAGAGVARGYLGLPEETSRRFVPDPWAEEPDARMYRTGDRVRRLPDGRLQYLGRSDEQVQVRGFRIEPAEVQEQLVGHPAVRDALVTALPADGHGSTGLVAYWVGRESAIPPGASSLRAYLSERLPHYMVPARFVALDAWPLTPHGKIDRRALPPPEPLEALRAPAAPRNELERTMVEIWRDVLGCEDVGIDDDFFDLGGQSLLAARIFSRLERELSLDLPLALLFEAPTIAALADHVSGVAPIETGGGLVQLQTAETRPPLFFLPGVGGHVLSFRELARALGPDQPSFGLQDPALDEDVPPFESIEEMAAHFVRRVREATDGPPYCLCGYSFGGTVALEMARQLRASGETRVFLGLIDTPAPGYPARLPFGRRMAVHLGNFTSGPIGHRARYGIQRVSNLRRRFAGARPVYEEEVAGVVTPRVRAVIAAHYRCYERYRFSTYPGTITLLRARQQPDWPGNSFDDPEMGWGALAGEGVRVHEVPGTHLEMLQGENRQALAAELSAALADFHAEDARHGARRRPAGALEGLRIGFLSTVDPNEPESISGMPFAMKQQLLRLGAHVEDVVPSVPALGRALAIGRRKLRGGARRILGERWVPHAPIEDPRYDDPVRAHDAFLSHALERSRDVGRQLEGRAFDVLFGCCVSTLLFDLETRVPVVYFSDTTARLINQTYPEYASKPQGYHEASERVERQGLARATAAVFATRAARDSAVSDYDVEPSRAHVVPMGANVAPASTDPFQEKQPPSRRRLELVLTAVDPVRKRTDTAVEIVEQLAAAGCEARLTLIGVPTQRAQESPHVHCAGFLRMSRPEDVARHREILARAHLMVLPSSGEAFGIATVEAALEGIPAVVSDVGGLPEAVVHGETGVVVPLAAPAEAYVRAILELVDDPERYAAMSRAARERALSEHTWDRWGDRVARLVRELVAETRAGYRRSG